MAGPLSIRRSAGNFVFTIEDGDTESDVVSIEGASFGLLFAPAEFDGSSITYNVYYTDKNTPVAYPLGDGSGGTVTTVIAAGEPQPVDPIVFGARWLQLVSNAAQSGADAVFRIGAKG